MHRRNLVLGSAAALSAGVALASGAPAAARQATSPAAELTPPSQRRGRFVELNGARIFYEVSGQGQPMLLIHGYPLSGALFIRVREHLASRFQVITLDLRGYGQSGTPAVPDSIRIYAEDALALLAALGVGRAYIGGMSMGGPIVLDMYSRAPQLFRGMVLIDTIAAAPTPAEARMWRGVAEQAELGGVEAVIPTVLHFMLTGRTRLRRPGLNAYLEAVMLEASREAAIGGALALAGRPDFTPLLGQIKVPTLVLVGAEDDVYPFEISRRIQRAIPGSTLAIVPDAAHAAVFEVPKAVAAAAR